MVTFWFRITDSGEARNRIYSCDTLEQAIWNRSVFIAMISEWGFCFLFFTIYCSSSQNLSQEQLYLQQPAHLHIVGYSHPVPWTACFKDRDSPAAIYHVSNFCYILKYWSKNRKETVTCSLFSDDKIIFGTAICCDVITWGLMYSWAQHVEDRPPASPAKAAPPLSSLYSWLHLHPSSLLWGHSWLLFFLLHSLSCPLIIFIGSILKYIQKTDHPLITSMVPMLAQALIISHMNYSKRLPPALPSSILAPHDLFSAQYSGWSF